MIGALFGTFVGKDIFFQLKIFWMPLTRGNLRCKEKHEKGRVYEIDTPPDKRRLTQTTEPSLPSPLCSCSY